MHDLAFAYVEKQDGTECGCFSTQREIRERAALGCGRDMGERMVEKAVVSKHTVLTTDD